MSDSSAVLDAPIQAEAHEENTPEAILGGFPVGKETGHPAWFREQQLRAWSAFESLPMPDRKDQAWRFANIAALDLSRYVHPPALSDSARREILDRSRGLEQTAARLVFADDQLIHRDSLPEELRKRGVLFMPLARALHEHEAIVRKHFMTQPVKLGSSKFAALHQALVTAGTFIYVPRGVEVELPLEVFHWLESENAAIFPHTLLIAEENSAVTFIEHFESTDPRHAGFAGGVNDLVAGAGAKLTYVCAQNWGGQVVADQINSTVVERDASALSLNVNLGAAYARFEGISRLAGTGARSDMLAVAVADERQEFDSRTWQDHLSPHTNSDLLYKNVLAGRARTIFGGLIRVEPDSHFTDAYQTVRNLLLSDDAEANSMPGLEILADNVKCSHGATSGQIDEDEMFYLRARGVPEKIAKQLIAAGFLNEAIGRLKNSAIAAKLHSLIEAKFARMNRAG